MFKNHNLHKKSKFADSFKGGGTFTSLPDNEDMMQGREYSYTDLTQVEKKSIHSIGKKQKKEPEMDQEQKNKRSEKLWQLMGEYI